MKRSRQHTGKVTITEVPPDADQIVQQLQKAPAQLRGVVQQLIKAHPLIEKGKRREGKLATYNQEKSREAGSRHAMILKTAQDLIAQKPILRKANPNSLAPEVSRRLAERGSTGKGFSVRNVRRVLTQKALKK